MAVKIILFRFVRLMGGGGGGVNNVKGRHEIKNTEFRFWYPTNKLFGGHFEPFNNS